MTKNYIDISKWQGNVDFSKLKGKVDGIIIRAGYGAGTIDTKFKKNISECNRLGIPCGVYWFSYARSADMAKAEAKYCLEAIKPYKVELPVCYDFEYDSVDSAKKNGLKITKELATAFVHAFCGEIQKAGYYAMNYSNEDFLQNYFNATTLNYDLWYARYPSGTATSPARSCGIWQYTSSGKIDGISGNVDMNYSYKDYAALIREKGMNNLVAAKAEAAEETKPWYFEAQEWAKEKGITDGSRPGDPATRAEIWSMLYRMNGGK